MTNGAWFCENQVQVVVNGASFSTNGVPFIKNIVPFVTNITPFIANITMFVINIALFMAGGVRLGASRTLSGLFRLARILLNVRQATARPPLPVFISRKFPT
jgi:hypothetical protein